MTASPLALASGFATAGWLPAQLTAMHIQADHSSRALRAMPAMSLRWLHHGTVLPLCEPKD
jgi:hypothetical protein